MRINWLYIILLLLSTGCSKDKEILTGDIMGRIVVYDEGYSPKQDRSGVQVALFKDTTLFRTMVTDVRGVYLFKNIAYGRYKINLEKEGYLGGMGNSYIYHVGGYSPTLTDGAVFRIPSINITIDSAKVFPSDQELKFYLKINGDTLIVNYWYPLIGYCSNSPDVSCENYISETRGRLSRRDNYNPVPLYGSIDSFDSKFKSLESDSIYIRLYPVAFGGYTYNSERSALGKPSNVVSFKWQ